jgi:hypothetical protein
MKVQTAEATALFECEVVIEEGLSNFVEVGNALMKIRDGRLYKGAYKTFEAYCKERWGMSRAFAHRTIEASGVCANLLPIGNVPQSESVARPLASLPPETQKEVWKEAVETAPEGKVTAKHVEAVASKKLHSVEPALEAKAEARAREADEDSEKLWSLKSTWRQTSKKDREKFLKWVKIQNQ